MIANKDFSFDHHFPSYLWQQNGTSPGFETNPNWLLEAFCVLNASGTYAKYGISYLCYLLFILKKGGLPNLQFRWENDVLQQGILDDFGVGSFDTTPNADG